MDGTKPPFSFCQCFLSLSLLSYRDDALWEEEKEVVVVVVEEEKEEEDEEVTHSTRAWRRRRRRRQVPCPSAPLLLVPSF